MKNLAWSLGVVAVLGSSSLVRADIPPPPGQTRVVYQYRVDTIPDGKTLVAYSTYNPKDQSTHAVVMRPSEELGTWQGYRPGLYLLSKADAAALPKDDGLERYLVAHALVCLKQIPRVFQVATKTNITKMLDVMSVELVDGKCETRLVRTVYESRDGKTGEGGVDATGKRTPPAPFSAVDLPGVNDSGLVLTPRRATK